MSGGRLVAGLFGLALTTLLAGALLYVSRFWTWRLWPQEGLFGLESLRRDGDQLRRGLREAAKQVGIGEFNAFDLLVWALVIFVVLSLLQWVWTAVERRVRSDSA